MRTLKFLIALALAGNGIAFASEQAAGIDWKTMHAGNEVENLTSLQRGARNFMGYCLGCHSLKYQRYSRTAEDLEIPPELFEKYLLPPGDKSTDYVLSTLPQAYA
jgi:ubiquinol-cytochrome c reductase cytochrome c1 subunit